MDIMANVGYKTYVNGGAVRDGILSTPIHDVDFSTDATPGQKLTLASPNMPSSGKPRHPRQKYLLTVKGLALYNELATTSE